jgi:hypothetical protein
MSVTAGDIFNVIRSVINESDREGDHCAIAALKVMGALVSLGAPSAQELADLINGDTKMVDVIRPMDHQGERTFVPVRRRPVAVSGRSSTATKPEGKVLPFRREE